MPSGAAVVEYRGKRGTVYRVKYADADGRQVMETLGPERDGWTRRKAEAELRERLVRVERKGYRRPRRFTFDEYARTWLEGCERRRGWRPATVKARRRQVRRLRDHFGPFPLGAIKPRHVAEYVEAMIETFSPASVNGDLDVLHDVLKAARREELVDGNAVDGAERPKIPRKRWRILEPAEVARVAKAFADEQARVAFLTLVLTGIRRGELQALRWKDVDLLEGVLRVRDSKTEEGERAIALPPTLTAALIERYQASAYRGADERVFCNPKTGGEYREETFTEAFRAALAAAGVEGHIRPFHDLRHTAITNDAASGASPIAVMAKAGHASMTTTKRYLHLAGVVFRDEAERLERRLLGLDAPTKAHHG